MPEDHLGDELLEVGILLHLPSRPVTCVLGTEQLVEISIHVLGKALKVADFVENGGGYNQNLFRLN